MNKLHLSNEAISIAVRDFLKFIIFLGVKLVLTYIIFQVFIKSINRPFRMCCTKYFTKSFLYYQQGHKSLKERFSSYRIKFFSIGVDPLVEGASFTREAHGSHEICNPLSKWQPTTTKKIKKYDVHS